MSPARIARRKERRLTFLGMVVETGFVLALSAFCCLLCLAIYFLVR